MANALREEGMRGLVIGLNTAPNETLGLGLLEGVREDGQEIQIRTQVKGVALLKSFNWGVSS
jgi:polynucleotide 5'-kinase involved in rRNA processing